MKGLVVEVDLAAPDGVGFRKSAKGAPPLTPNVSGCEKAQYSHFRTACNRRAKVDCQSNEGRVLFTSTSPGALCLKAVSKQAVVV